MPIVDHWPGPGEKARPRYALPLAPLDAGPDIATAWRRWATQARESMLSVQKASPDRDTARFFKDEAAARLRLQRAADLWARELGGERVAQWPLELAAEADFIGGCVSHGLSPTN